jgi:hypothetical protein
MVEVEFCSMTGIRGQHDPREKLTRKIRSAASAGRAAIFLQSVIDRLPGGSSPSLALPEENLHVVRRTDSMKPRPARMGDRVAFS